nr:hypothetical protein [Tanacetum cinerariifolium]
IKSPLILMHPLIDDQQNIRRGWLNHLVMTLCDEDDQWMH